MDMAPVNPRTHCKSGRHELTPENLYVSSTTGFRHCKPCQLEREIAASRARGIKKWEPPEMPTDPAVLAYAAGIIDGEGSIGIRRARNSKSGVMYYRAAVRATSTDLCLIEWMCEHFGGACTTTKPQTEGHRIPYHWTLTSGATAAFLKAIRPYMVIKGPQADLALAFYDTKLRSGDGRGIITPELREYRESLRQQIFALNHRGTTVI